jgi:hypothetical protein
LVLLLIRESICSMSFMILGDLKIKVLSCLTTHEHAIDNQSDKIPLFL